MGRPLVEETTRVDVRRAFLGRPLRPGCALELTVTPAGKARARETAAAPDVDAFDTHRRVRLEVVFAPCRFGGERAYLLCPRCRHRRLTLFVRGTEVGCRACSGLGYRTQNLTDADRLDLRAERIERALGGGGGRSDPLPPRPAGMHRTTYRRRVDRVLDLRWRAQDARDAKEDAWFARRWPGIVRRYFTAAPRSA
jgi:hypothetical protein